MKKILTFLFFIGVIAGVWFLGGRVSSNEDAWICQANAWTLHGKPSAPVPTDLCEGKKTVYLDVRTLEEWNQGHIKGAIHFSLDRLEAGESPDVPKDSSIQVYCRSGNRAGTAQEILKTAGFKEVINAGGLEDLRTKGFPVE